MKITAGFASHSSAVETKFPSETRKNAQGRWVTYYEIVSLDDLITFIREQSEWGYCQPVAIIECFQDEKGEIIPYIEMYDGYVE